MYTRLSPILVSYSYLNGHKLGGKSAALPLSSTTPKKHIQIVGLYSITVYISPYINNTIYIYIYIKMYPQYIYVCVCLCVCFKTIHHLYTNHATILLVKSHGLAICCANSNYFLVLTSLSKITYRPRGLPKPRIPVTLYYQTCFARGTMQ